MNISLPDTLKQFVDQQVSRAGYGSVSDYLRHLIRQEQARQAERGLAELIRQGLESRPGPAGGLGLLGRQAGEAPGLRPGATPEGVKPVRVRPLADADIDAALAYLRARNRTAASRFVAALERAFQRLSRDPGMGSPRYAHVLPVEGLRAWKVQGFPRLIFYLERPDHVDVVRVLHGARDVPAALREDPPE